MKPQDCYSLKIKECIHCLYPHVDYKKRVLSTCDIIRSYNLIESNKIRFDNLSIVDETATSYINPHFIFTLQLYFPDLYKKYQTYLLLK
jgi:hypothetical protein